MAADTTLRLALSCALSGYYRTQDHRGVRQQDFDARETGSLITGQGAGQADQLFADVRVLGPSGVDILDLSEGLTDAFGLQLAFDQLVAVLLVADAQNAADLLVGGGASAFSACFGAADDRLRVKPGGILLLLAPGAPAYPVTDGVADQLRVVNTSSLAPVAYEIVLVGRSPAGAPGALDFSDPANSGLLIVI